MEAPIDLVVGPDGGHVYVADSAGIKAFARDATTGALTYEPTKSSLTAMSPVAMVMGCDDEGADILPPGVFPHCDIYVIDGATHNLLHFRVLEGAGYVPAFLSL